jgi:hypothetical protein
MTNSIERETENQIINAITANGVSGVNLYTSERSSDRLLPFLAVFAKIDSEELAPFTGIFSMTATMSYTARADTISSSDFDNKFESILQSFYTLPNIASQMTTASSEVQFYFANVRSVLPRVQSPKRTWTREIIVDITATSKMT